MDRNLRFVGSLMNIWNDSLRPRLATDTQLNSLSSSESLIVRLKLEGGFVVTASVVRVIASVVIASVVIASCDSDAEGVFFPMGEVR